ncbi:hypothetical protein LTR85_002499 [Meristemomyces frigidus]|nr:hypothetical protein LTR85_002499 [Meristemomyces frigidus]
MRSTQYPYTATRALTTPPAAARQERLERYEPYKTGSNVFIRSEAGRLRMRGTKRPTEDTQDGSNSRQRTGKAVVPITEVDVPEGHFDSLGGADLDEEMKAQRAYGIQLFKQVRKTKFASDKWIKTRILSRRRGRVGLIVLIPVIEFRMNQNKPNEECLDRVVVPDGILIIKLRPALLCENADYGLRCGPFTGFGDSDPTDVVIQDEARGRRWKLTDYVQFVEREAADSVQDEPRCFDDKIIFRGNGDYDFSTMKERYGHVYEYYKHPHGVPFMIIGELDGHPVEREIARLEALAAAQTPALPTQTAHDTDEEGFADVYGGEEDVADPVGDEHTAGSSRANELPLEEEMPGSGPQYDDDDDNDDRPSASDYIAQTLAKAQASTGQSHHFQTGHTIGQNTLAHWNTALNVGQAGGADADDEDAVDEGEEANGQDGTGTRRTLNRAMTTAKTMNTTPQILTRVAATARDQKPHPPYR